MKSVLLAVLASLFFQSFVFGQKFSKDFDITPSTPYVVVDASTKVYYPTEDGYGIAVKANGTERVIIQRFGVSNFKEVSRKEYEDFPKDARFEDIIRTADRLYFIYSMFNKKADKFTFYSREINMTTGEFNSPVSIFETGGDVAQMGFVTWSMWSGTIEGPRLNVVSSFDGDKILFNYRRKPLSRRDKENYDILGFHVYDADMKKIWGEEVTMPHTEAEMNNIGYALTRDGVAHLLAYMNTTHSFELINIDNGNLQVHNLSLPGNFYFNNFHILEDVSGNLICSGYFAEEAGSGSVNGIKHFVLTTDGNIRNNNDYEFPVDLINQYESKRTKEKNEKKETKGKLGITDLQLRDVVTNSDGSTMFVGEQYYTVTTTTTTSSGTTTRTTYYYADVVLTRIDKSGNLMWHRKLPKSQKGGAGRGGMGIRYIQGPDASYVLYLDNLKNANLDINEVPEWHVDGKGGFLCAYKVENETGEVSKHVLFNSDDFKGTELHQFTTSRIFPVTDRIFMLESYIKGKKDMMIKLEIVE